MAAMPRSEPGARRAAAVALGPPDGGLLLGASLR
jgi:hypothetical protein